MDVLTKSVEPVAQKKDLESDVYTIFSGPWLCFGESGSLRLHDKTCFYKTQITNFTNHSYDLLIQKDYIKYLRFKNKQFR